MTRGISLRRFEEAKQVILNRGTAYRIVIEAYDAESMPDKIFLCRRIPLDLSTGLTGEEFCAICAPDDLTYYPADTPNVAQDPAFYRKNRIDVLVQTADIGLKMWEEVRKQVARLIEALNQKDELILPEEVRCGSAITDISVST